MPGQYKLSQFGHADRASELQCLLRLKLPPPGLGVDEPCWATACGRKGQQSPSFDQFRLQLFEASRRGYRILLRHE